MDNVSSQSSLYLLAPTRVERQALSLLFRVELRREIQLESGFAPVEIWNAMRSNPDMAIISADRVTPDVRDAALMIPRLRKSTRLIVLGAEVEQSALQPWRGCELGGYVVKDGGVDELRTAFAEYDAGRTYFSVNAFEALHAGGDSESHPPLSRRESELLPLLARGLTLREAATRMTVSYKTADSYRTSLLRKLGIRDRVALVRYAIRERIVDL